MINKGNRYVMHNCEPYPIVHVYVYLKDCCVVHISVKQNCKHYAMDNVLEFNANVISFVFNHQSE